MSDAANSGKLTLHHCAEPLFFAMTLVAFEIADRLEDDHNAS